MSVIEHRPRSPGAITGPPKSQDSVPLVAAATFGGRSAYHLLLDYRRGAHAERGENSKRRAFPGVALELLRRPDVVDSPTAVLEAHLEERLPDPLNLGVVTFRT